MVVLAFVINVSVEKFKMRSMCFSSASVLINSFLACHHSITDFEINAFLNQDSYRLLKFVRFSFNFRHWLILSYRPIAISQSLGL